MPTDEDKLEEWLQSLIRGLKGKRGDNWQYEYDASVKEIVCYHNGGYLDHQPLDWYREHYRSNVRWLEIVPIVYIGGE